MSIIKRLKNNSGSDRIILTRSIADQDYYDVPYRLWVEILDDEDLMADVLTGDIIVNDGNSDLSVADGIAWLKRFQAKEPPEIDLNSNIGSIFQYDFARIGSCNNKWLYRGHGNSSNTTFAVIPFKCKIISVTYSNKNNGADTILQLWKSDINDDTNKSNVLSWALTNARIGRKTNFTSDIELEAGDKLAVFLSDTGKNASGASVTVFFKILDDNSEEQIENFSGGF